MKFSHVLLLSVVAFMFAACSSDPQGLLDDIGTGDEDGIIVHDDHTAMTDDGSSLPDVSDGSDIPVTDSSDIVVQDDGPATGDQTAVDEDEPAGDGLLTDETSDGEQPDDLPVDCTPDAVEECAYSGDPITLNVGVCKAGTRTCASDGKSWSDCSGEVLPSFDVCVDALDNDCNSTMNDGFPLGADGCACLPLTTDSCYEGASDTLDVGLCHAGTKTCTEYGNAWGGCLDQVLPVIEVPGDGFDNDCDGTVDEEDDEDGDGYGSAVDCCDNAVQCADPALVNPGAVEVQGDGIDNDCNGQTDEDPRTDCSSGAKFGGVTAIDLLNGMDICKVALNGSWGIIGTPTLTRSNSECDQTSGGCNSTCTHMADVQGGAVDDKQIALMEQFGTDGSNVRLFGGNMSALSSGRARDANDPDPTTSITYSYADGSAPADFLNAHGTELPQTSSGCTNGSGANDSVMLTFQLKVPTNAQSFSFNFRFFSQEYMQYTCSAYNDFFIAMLYTGATGIPADKNVSFDSNGSYISVNSTAFFTVCSPKSGYSCPDGTAALAGTGWDASNAGATKWLSTTAPVIRGETITLKFVIWDTSDQLLDSLVLIDNFKWSAQGTSGPLTFECWDLNQNGACDAASEDKSGDGLCSERDC